MTRQLGILILLLTSWLDIYSHSDTLKNKINFGLGVNPVIFVAYNPLYSNKFIDRLTLGLDVNFLATKGRHTVSLGAIFGDSYPILPLAKYYCGYDFKFTPDKWKLEILGTTKFAFFHHKDKYLSSVTTIWQSYSILFGATVQKKINRISIGLSYLGEWGNVNFKQINNSNSQTLVLYDKTDFMQTGYFIIKVNYFFGRRPSHNTN